METKGLVVVAVGLPGAGKSRFHEKFMPDAVRCCAYRRLERVSFAVLPSTVRTGQDLPKRREKVEALVEETVLVHEPI